MNRNLKSIAAAALLHANVHVKQVLTQTHPTNPIMGWVAISGAPRKGTEKWSDRAVAGLPPHYRSVLSDANTDANRYRNVCGPSR